MKAEGPEKERDGLEKAELEDTKESEKQASGDADKDAKENGKDAKEKDDKDQEVVFIQDVGFTVKVSAVRD